MDQIRKVISALGRSLGTPRALSAVMLADAGEWTQLQKLRVKDPKSYLSAEDYFKDALITELLRKCDLPNDVDKEEVALQTFRDTEARCYATNVRLMRFLPETLFIEDGDEPVARFIDAWRKEVRTGLPSLPLFLTPRFSGGATYADVGSLTTIPDKMSSVPTIYPSCRDLSQFFWETSWGKSCVSRAPCDVRGNIFFTVPKDSEKFRGCAKEASIPVTLQLDAARHLRIGLKAWKIDLKQGWLQHRLIAQQSSKDGLKATLDQSNASDTVCRVLVKLLLPKEWFSLLDSLRATHTRVKGKWVRLEKFSSMGNGFTFELETLIFASLARTLVRLKGGDPDQVQCYGDDLIVPTNNVADVISALKYFGFEPNERKSFWEGPFRESCGGDFFDGEPVRAHYLKKLPDEPQHWIAFANGLRRVDPSMRYVKSAWQECIKNIPKHIRQCRGPTILGDLVLHDDPEYWQPRITHRSDGLEDLVEFRVYRPVPINLDWHHWKDDIITACAVLGMPSTGITPRGGVSGYRLAWSEAISERGGRWLPSAR